MNLSESILDYLKVCGIAEPTELSEVFKVQRGWLSVLLEEIKAKHLIVFDGKTIMTSASLKKIWQKEAENPTKATPKKEVKPRVRRIQKADFSDAIKKHSQNLDKLGSKKARIT